MDKALNIVTGTTKWSPNIAVVESQDGWWEHFHSIESESFTSLEQANQEFAEWKKRLLASRSL